MRRLQLWCFRRFAGNRPRTGGGPRKIAPNGMGAGSEVGYIIFVRPGIFGRLKGIYASVCCQEDTEIEWIIDIIGFWFLLRTIFLFKNFNGIYKNTL